MASGRSTKFAIPSARNRVFPKTTMKIAFQKHLTRALYRWRGNSSFDVNPIGAGHLLPLTRSDHKIPVPFHDNQFFQQRKPEHFRGSLARQQSDFFWVLFRKNIRFYVLRPNPNCAASRLGSTYSPVCCSWRAAGCAFLTYCARASADAAIAALHGQRRLDRVSAFNLRFQCSIISVPHQNNSNV